jgi:Anti-sigma-K factor rskA, C-terminal
MAGELSRHELDSLLGAHALDAVDSGEREQIDRYLAQNPSARAEIEETREVMSLLVDAEEGSPALWTRIEAEISRRPDTTNVRPLSAPPHARRPRFARRALALVAAAVAIVLAVLAVGELSDGGGSRIADRQAKVRAAAEEARGDPEARRAALADGDGVVRATVVRLPDGTGYVTNNGLRELPSGRTYQLWALMDDTTGPAFVSAGVLGHDLDVAAFRFNGRVRGFAISTERTPGALAPHHPLAAEGSLA